MEDENGQIQLTTIFMHYLLLKVGGQATLNVADINPLVELYAGTRIALNQEDGTITLTLRTRERENEQALTHEQASEPTI